MKKSKTMLKHVLTKAFERDIPVTDAADVKFLIRMLQNLPTNTFSSTEDNCELTVAGRQTNAISWYECHWRDCNFYFAYNNVQKMLATVYTPEMVETNFRTEDGNLDFTRRETYE